MLAMDFAEKISELNLKRRTSSMALDFINFSTVFLHRNFLSTSKVRLNMILAVTKRK